MLSHSRRRRALGYRATRGRIPDFPEQCSV